jgi:hypothetical protein
MLVFFVTALITAPFTANINLARIVVIYLLLYYTVAVATAVYVKTPRQAMPIVLMIALQFAWFAFFAGTQGIVSWHPTLSNHDGYGSFAVAGVGICYWFAVGAKERKWKLLFYALALHAVLGVVSSYARAAFLSLLVVAGWIWVRSPNKGVTALAGVVGGIAVMVGASLFFDAGFFWAEMASAFSEGNTEGTGGERWKLWMAAIEVWKLHPILGVGGGNFGAFAASYFRPGELAGFDNPNVLYGFNLHSAYFQILSEFGLVGMFAFGWALVDFQRKNALLRRDAARQTWHVGTGGKLDLKFIALALESANIANLLAGVFYASLFMPWFWTIFAANRMLWAVTKPTARRRPLARGRHRAATPGPRFDPAPNGAIERSG